MVSPTSQFSQDMSHSRGNKPVFPKSPVSPKTNNTAKNQELTPVDHACWLLEWQQVDQIPVLIACLKIGIYCISLIINVDRDKFSPHTPRISPSFNGRTQSPSPFFDQVCIVDISRCTYGILTRKAVPRSSHRSQNLRNHYVASHRALHILTVVLIPLLLQTISRRSNQANIWFVSLLLCKIARTIV